MALFAFISDEEPSRELKRSGIPFAKPVRVPPGVLGAAWSCCLFSCRELASTINALEVTTKQLVFAI